MITSLLILASASIPLIGIFAYGWSPIEIAYLWFAEAILYIPVLAVYRRFAKKPLVDWDMIGIYAFWMTILTLLFVVFSLSMGIGDMPLSAILSAIRIPLLFVVAMQIIDLATANRRGSDYFLQNNLIVPMLSLHLTVVLGFALLGLLDGIDKGSLIAGVILVTVHTIVSLTFRLKAVKVTR